MNNQNGMLLLIILVFLILFASINLMLYQRNYQTLQITAAALDRQRATNMVHGALEYLLQLPEFSQILANLNKITPIPALNFIQVTGAITPIARNSCPKINSVNNKQQCQYAQVKLYANYGKGAIAKVALIANVAQSLAKPDQSLPIKLYSFITWD